MAGIAQALPAIMSTVGTVLSVKGNLDAGDAAAGLGQQQRSATVFEARQLEQQAGQEIASSQRTAQERRREMRLAESRALALAAASGGGTDRGVMDIISKLAGEGAYRAMSALYEGDERARKLRLAGAGARAEGEMLAQSGENRKKAFQINAITAGVKGMSSLYAKYGGGGPTNAPRGDEALMFNGVSLYEHP